MPTHPRTHAEDALIVADILVVNKAFARTNPEMVAGLVSGLLEGNRMVRDNPDAHLDLIAQRINDRLQGKEFLEFAPENSV